MKVGFVGGGNMAESLIAGLLRKGFPAADIGVAEIRAGAREHLAQGYGVATFERMTDEFLATDVVVLAVKPQQLRGVCEEFAGRLDTQVVLSIAAGIRSTDISRWLRGYGRVVRAMPNTPALIGAGIAGLYAPAGVTANERKHSEAILGAVGEVVWVEAEGNLDAITAVSGSGPAYVFYFIEALQEAGRELGLDAQAARRLALHTFHGASRLALESGEEAAALRARVTSPGGTTQAAIAHMDEQAVRRHIMDAVRAAADRAIELADRFGRE
jgi:pyrroline-5-carboxylate reductase